MRSRGQEPLRELARVPREERDAAARRMVEEHPDRFTAAAALAMCIYFDMQDEGLECAPTGPLKLPERFRRGASD